MKIQSNKLTDKQTGVVLEYKASDVATGVGQLVWLPHVGVGHLTRTVENWINDNGTPNLCGYTDTSGTLTGNAAMPKLHTGQGFIMWTGAEYAGAQNSFTLGDAGSVGAIKQKKSVSILTGANGETLTTPAFDIAASPEFQANVYDPVAETFTAYQYDLAGNITDTKVGFDSGAFDFTAPINFPEATLNSTMVTEITGFNLGSFGIVYFDTLPDDLFAGLASMSADLDSGCYAPWKLL